MINSTNKFMNIKKIADNVLNFCINRIIEIVAIFFSALEEKEKLFWVTVLVCILFIYLFHQKPNPLNQLQQRNQLTCDLYTYAQ